MKIQIRTIRDIQGNVYDIYDFMVKTRWGLWRSMATYENLEDALRWHKGVEIEDVRDKK